MHQLNTEENDNKNSKIKLYSYLSKDAYILELSNNLDFDQDRFDRDRFEYESRISGGN